MRGDRTRLSGGVGLGLAENGKGGTPRRAIRLSLWFQVVGYLALIVDGEVPGLPKNFNAAQGIGFGNFMSQVGY